MKLVFTRREYKYRVPYHLLDDCINYFSKKMITDDFNKGVEPYIIRSLYYDSPTYMFYTQKVRGNNNRTKIRLRTYGNEKNAAPVFLEFKNKLGEKIFKERAVIKPKYLEDVYLRNIPIDDKVFEAYKYNRQLYGIRPAALVVYDRIAFLQDNLNFKVTIDYNIDTINSSDLWFPRSSMHRVNTKVFVLEMKFEKSIPDFFTKYVMAHNLQRKPFSKYTKSIDALNRVNERAVFI